MDPSDLEDRIVSTVQEMQVKLGQSSGSLSLYLPLDCMGDDVDGEIARFREHVRPTLGDISCVLDGERARRRIDGKKQIETGRYHLKKVPLNLQYQIIWVHRNV